MGQADQTHLRRAVVGLTEVAVQTRRGCGHDDAPVLLFAHVHPCWLRHVERAAQVDVDHRVDEIRGHVVEALVAQDAGVVHHDVDAPEGVERGLDDGLPAFGRGHGVGVGDGLAPGGFDLVDHLLGRARVTARTVDRATDVVHDDECAPAREQDRMFTAEPAARAGDDRHLAVESEVRHRHSVDRPARAGPTVAGRGPVPPRRAPARLDRVRAVRATGDGGVGVVEVVATAPDHARDPVRVRMRSCGICGSDLHLAAWNIPVTLGHEFAGVLDDGTAVAVQPIVWCGACDRCLAGEPQQCRTGLSRLHGVSVDGGLADEVIVDRSCLVPLPEGASPEIGALVEPLAVAGHALGRVSLDSGARILVIGGGSIGLALVAVARGRGIEVDLTARYAHQHEAGERLGARRELETEYDVVVDAAGSQSSFDDAITRVRPGGTIVVAATYWDGVSFGSNLLGKEAHVVPAAMYGHDHDAREFETAAALLGSRPEIADALISHRFGLDDAAEAFRVSGDRASGAIKIVLGP